MQPRIDINRHISSPSAQALSAFSAAVTKAVDQRLFDLVKIRASQVNGCAFCIDMHTKNARQNGETEQRLYALNAWRETPFFTDRERAALEWTEELTLIASTRASDAAYARASSQFKEDELVALTMAIVVINAWNRVATSFRAPAGSYRPVPAPAAV